jgi:hypothetical protein
MSKVKKRVWSPDDDDIRIVEALSRLSGPDGVANVARGKLPVMLTMAPEELQRRIRLLCKLEYLRCEQSARRGFERFTVLKTPSKGDEVNLGLYGLKSRGTIFTKETVNEAAALYQSGTTIKALMERYNASYEVVKRVLTDAGAIGPGQSPGHRQGRF